MTNRTVATCGAAAVVLASLVASPAGPAQATPISACVNKSTGAMTILKKKKCKKGWKKVTWNNPGATGPQGPQGATGAAGPSYSVVDKTGALVGDFRMIRYVGESPEIRVQRDGGWWNYGMGDGKLQTTGPVYYLNPSCTGAAYVRAYPDNLADWLSYVGGPGRAVERSWYPITPARAYVLTSTVIPVVANTDYYALYSNNVCSNEGTATPGSYFVAYQEVPAPPDFTGPLTIR